MMAAAAAKIVGQDILSSNQGYQIEGLREDVDKLVNIISIRA